MENSIAIHFELKRLTHILLIALLSVGSLKAQTKTRLEGFETPLVGHELDIKYNCLGGPLEHEAKPIGLVYMFNDYVWQIDDVLLTKENDSIYTGTFKVPENCAFVAFKVYAIDKDDGHYINDTNDDKGYMATTLKDGKNLPGGNLAWGIFRKPELGKGVLGYFEKFTISDEALEFWIKKEMEYHANYLPKYFTNFLAMVKLRTGNNFNKAANKFITQYRKDFPVLSENNLLELRNICLIQLQDKGHADILEKEILEKFPHGKFMRFKRYNVIRSEPLDAKKVADMSNFIEEYPYQEWLKDGDAKDQKYIYDKMFTDLASAYFASNQDDKLMALLSQVPFNTLVDIYHWNIDRAYKLKLVSLTKIYNVSKALINEMLSKVEDNTYMDGVRFSPQQALMHARALMNDKLALHIQILNDLDKTEEAQNYYLKIDEDKKFVNADMNEAYLETLIKLDASEYTISHYLENAVKANMVTPKMYDELKALYVKAHKNEDGYDSYLFALKNEKAVVLKQEIQGQLIKEKVNLFSLSGMNGIHVTPKNLEGKIVVLDFWANWCMPCKKSFPGMQLAVNKYENDNSVAFYFIATMETRKDFKEKICEYIQKKGYTFNVLYDEYQESTHQNNKVFSTYTPIFKSSAIPRKIIIKDGYIRYTTEGYGGSPSQLADEISQVIELLKEENIK